MLLTCSWSIGPMFWVWLRRKLPVAEGLIICEEEIYCYQRSREKWLLQRENNTKFFHTSVVARRARKQVVKLKDSKGKWVWELTQLQLMVMDFYKELYTAKPLKDPLLVDWNFPKLLRVDDRNLHRYVSSHEVHRAVMEMGAPKALRPDEILSLFYKKY